MGKTAGYTSVDLGRLLYKSRHEPRRNQKRFLKDLGGEGSAEELDRILAIAEADKRAVAECQRLEAEQISHRDIDVNSIARVAEMIGDIRLKMEALKLTQAEVAERCGWQQPQVAAYLSGAREPGVINLVKLADAVGCVWRLAKSATRSTT